MKRLLSIFMLLILLFCLTSCDTVEEGEYEVISVAAYTVITGTTEDGPVEEIKLAFVYMDNGTPKMVSEYSEWTSYSGYKKYIIIGETNKYVVVHEYRKTCDYLYLTQETYEDVFGGK